MILSLPASLAPAKAPPPEPPAAYELVAGAALDRVPIQYRSIFEPHRQAILSCASGGGAGRFAPSPVLMRAESHYLMLDAAATELKPADRLKAARAFPRDAKQAEKLLTERGQREGGRLPWTLAEQCDLLTTAIHDRNEPESARLAGVVIHLAVDACLPFHTTTQPLGPTASQFVLPQDEAAETYEDCASARGRAQDAIIRRHRADLASSLAAGDSLCLAVDNVQDAAFQALIRAAAALDALLDADHALMDRWALRDGESLVAIAEPLLIELDGRCQPLVTSQLDAAACFSAALLVRCAAMAQGETPPPVVAEASKGNPSSTTGAGRLGAAGTGDSAVPAPASVGSPPPDAGKAAAGAPSAIVVGSKNSKKFHRPTCKWAKSINEGNRVTFPSCAAAVADGREPCSTCDPRD